MKQIIHIEGMTCQGCASSVEEAIAQLPAVESVSANPKTGVVTVMHQSEVHTDEIKAVLSFSTLKGFSIALGVMTHWLNPLLSMVGYIRL
jgi:copper chaperone CopZ